MDKAHADAAASAIWRHWQDGTVMAALGEGLAPATRADGYAVQAALERFSAAPRAGWKIAATSTAGQTHINVDGPLAGRLFEEWLHGAGETISIARNRMRVCEPEFAFRLGEDIAPGAQLSVDAVMGRVSALHLAFEFPDSRFAEFTAAGGPGLIADNACARDLLVGPEVTADWRALDLSAHPVHAVVHGRYERDGNGANVLGDPRVAMAWLVNEASALGIPLAKGELVTTGTCVPPLEIEPGDRITADFGVLGQLEARVAP